MPLNVGNVPVGNQTLRTFSVDTNPDQFGAGVGKAIRGLGIAFDDFAVAEKRKKDFLAQVSFIKWAGETQRAMLERQNEAEPGAPEFTNQINAELEQRKQEFLSTLTDPDLQQAYAAQVEQAVQGMVNSAYAFEQSSSAKFALGEISDMTDAAYSQVQLDPGIIEASLSAINTAIDTTPYLSPQEKIEAKKAAKEQLLASHYLAQVRDGQIGVNAQIGSANGSDIVAAGMPALGRGVLNAIAGPESGGRYDLTYQNKNGDGITFKDFSRHPNHRVLITEGPHKGEYSTAAGRYQFRYATWITAAKLAGVHDFSPVSQDKAAWAWAKHIYQRATDRELVKDLGSGDRNLVKEARQILAREWAGLAHVTDDAFANSVLGAKGVLGPQPKTEYTAVYPLDSIFSDSMYADLSSTWREALFDKGTSIAEGINQDEARAQKDEYDTKLNDLENQIIEGNAQMDDILAAEKDWLTDAADRLQVRRLVEGVNSAGAAYNAVQAARVANAPEYWDPTDSGQKKQLNAWYQYSAQGAPSGAQHVAAGDLNWIASDLIPTVNATGIVPSGFAGQIKNILSTGKFEDVQFAVDTLAMIRENNQAKYNEYFDNDTKRMVGMFEFYQRKGADQQEIMNRIHREYDSAQINLNDQYVRLADSKFTEWLNDGSLTDTIINNIDAGEAPILPAQVSALHNDYQRMFRAAIVDYAGDIDAATKAAGEATGKVWRETNFGQSRITWLPPEASYPPNMVTGDWSLWEQQLRQELGLKDNESYILVPDHRTWKEYQAYELAKQTPDPTDDKEVPLPSYLVYRDAVTGLRNESGQIVRWHGKVTPEMEQMQNDILEEHHAQGELDVLEQILNEKTTTAAYLSYQYGPYDARVKAALEEVAKARAAYEKGRVSTDPLTERQERRRQAFERYPVTSTEVP